MRSNHCLIKGIENVRDLDTILICFPHAGGGATIYRQWEKKLKGNIRVCPIQLPGREELISVKPYTDMRKLIEDLYERIKLYRDHDIYLFGHSMGAKIAYFVAKKMEENEIEIKGLVVSGNKPPDCPISYPLGNLPDNEFKVAIERFDGIPNEIMENEILFDFFLPMLKADFKLDESYCPQSVQPVHCPIIAFGGMRDKEADLKDILKWKDYTISDFFYQMFPGGHFFIRDYEDELLRKLIELFKWRNIHIKND